MHREKYIIFFILILLFVIVTAALYHVLSASHKTQLNPYKEQILQNSDQFSQNEATENLDFTGGIFGGYSNAAELQRQIYNRFPKFRVKGNPYSNCGKRKTRGLKSMKKSFEEFCFPKSFKIQPSQGFVSEYMAPILLKSKSPLSKHIRDTKGLLVYHKIGAGKSCAAITIAEKWIKYAADNGLRSKPMIVTAASLIPGFRNEIRGPCGVEHHEYISEEDAAALLQSKPSSPEYKRIIKDSNEIISHRYKILSYNKFLEDYKSGSLGSVPSILIVDEVQNINNISGSYFGAISGYIDKHAEMPVVLLSGTPLFDGPRELIGLMRLLRIESGDLSQGANYTKQNLPSPADVERLFTGKVSFYPGAPDFTFPRAEITLLFCEMSAFQSRWYRSQVASERKKGMLVRHEIPNDFYIKSRQRANIVYPNGLTGLAGLNALTPSMISGPNQTLKTYSAKFNKLLKFLSQGELSFIYTSFAEYGGIAALTKCLDARGYKDFAKFGSGRNRYAIWSGEETDGQKEIVRATFNSRQNDDGSQIRIIVGSPAIKEGVSLMRVRQVHILEPYWNHSRLAQIYGRALRYCSHKNVPKSQRAVDIYIYVAICYDLHGKKSIEELADPDKSIDAYMLSIADAKKEESDPYIKALQNCAVDKKLYKL